MITLRLAYLISQHPTPSHVFVDRELAALRARGVDVQTYSLRRPDTLGGDGHVQVIRERRAWRLWLRAHLTLLAAGPGRYIRGLVASLGAGPPGLRSRVWQVFYWSEAVVLVQLLRRDGLRHVHVHFGNSGADVGRRAVAVARTSYEREGPWSWSLSVHGPGELANPDAYDLAAKAADAAFVACISDFCERGVRAAAPTAETTVVHMGVELSRYPYVYRDRPPGPLRVLFVGRLVVEKCPADLLAAVEELASVELVVAGEGALSASLRRNAGGGVRFLGTVGQEDLPGWYAWADVFCLPSRAEGLPVVLMEAMATGLPVVTTPVGGIPELVVDGGNGLLVDPGDVAGIGAALERLRDGDLRACLGRAGRAAVEAGFDADSAVLPLLAAFERTLAAQAVSS